MLKSQLCFSNSHPVCAVDVVFSHPEEEYCVMTMKYLNKLYEHKFIKVHHHNLVFTVSLYCTYSENICVFGRICLKRECCAFSLLRSWFCFTIHSTKKSLCICCEIGISFFKWRSCQLCIVQTKAVLWTLIFRYLNLN